MTVDSLLADFLIKFVLPIILSAMLMFAFGAQGRSRRPSPMLLAVIGRLVQKDIFDADDLVAIGVLEPMAESAFNPVELVKLLRNG